MSNKIILLLFLIVFNVQCSENTNSNNLRIKRSEEQDNRSRKNNQVYNFNHPPSVDEYAPIPVEVVFESSDDGFSNSVNSSTLKPFPTKSETEKASKKLVTNFNRSNVENVSDEKTNDPYKITLNNDFSTTASNLDLDPDLRKPGGSDSDHFKILKDKVARNKNIYEIPVAVLYENDTEKSKPQSKGSRSEKETNPRRKVSTGRSRGNKTRTEVNTSKSVTEEPSAVTKDQVSVNIKARQRKLNESVIIATQEPDSETKDKKIENLKASFSGVENTGAKQEFKKRSGGKPPIVPIVDSENFLTVRGSYHYKYEGGDGTKAYGRGELKTINETAGEAVVGGFSYTDKEGNAIELTYTADENGYRPVGAHLPTPPPIPPAIARALAHLATKTTPEPVTRPDVTPATAD